MLKKISNNLYERNVCNNKEKMTSKNLSQFGFCDIETKIILCDNERDNYGYLSKSVLLLYGKDKINHFIKKKQSNAYLKIKWLKKSDRYSESNDLILFKLFNKYKGIPIYKIRVNVKEILRRYLMEDRKYYVFSDVEQRALNLEKHINEMFMNTAVKEDSFIFTEKISDMSYASEENSSRYMNISNNKIWNNDNYKLLRHVADILYSKIEDKLLELKNFSLLYDEIIKTGEYNEIIKNEVELKVKKNKIKL